LPIVKTASWDRRATSRSPALALPLALLACAACGAKEALPAGAPPGASTVASAPRPAGDFAFDSLDDRPVSAEATRGKLTVLVFVTTGSLSAQAQVNFLVAMAKHDADRVNYAVVALEPRENRELVEIYRRLLSVSFPVAMADPQTLAGHGAFGDVSEIPVTVMLDRAGRIVWRVDGRVVKSEELRVAMRGL
jgi:hypothetical protein